MRSAPYFYSKRPLLMTQLSIEKQLLSIVCSVFDAYSAVLFLPEGESETCILTASYSLGEKIATGASVLKGKGLVGWIARNKEPLLVPNVDQHQNVLNYYRDGEESAIKAFMGCPIETGGVLCVDSKRQYSFSDKDCKILQLFAKLMENAQLTQTREDLSSYIEQYFTALSLLPVLRQRSRSWAGFLKDFLEIMVRATGFDYCAFASVDVPQESFLLEMESTPILLGDEPMQLSMGGNIIGCVFRNGEPVVQCSAAEQLLFGRIANSPTFQAVICMPLLLNKSTRGVLCLGSAKPVDVNDAMRSFVQQAMDYMSLYVETLYLKNRVQNMLPKAQLYRNSGNDAHSAPEAKEEDK
jgi:signal transduction protein with GAF and PtsI domain